MYDDNNGNYDGNNYDVESMCRSLPTDWLAQRCPPSPQMTCIHVNTIRKTRKQVILLPWFMPLDGAHLSVIDYVRNLGVWLDSLISMDKHMS